ncbi:hypothetical protein F971_03117 [Acinetobacter vivianii]|uniref:Uncharacterized protein n=1 Tax=Acinetobacter vivianii TaxID=1776742 RepID=N8WAR6_9GAMM|nr:hypothetical protein [Acinetobacter vivianii]ENU92024.1 hypothetical protein F971_03117 [Acinetobacter vivianii]
MQEVIDYIGSKKEDFGQHPFFELLFDDELPVSNKLSFMPYMAYFIMSFGDINKYVLPFKSPKDNYEIAINLHAKEDEKHWNWYLEDLQSLNFDKKRAFTDVLETLWSDDFSASRELTYKLVSLIHNQSAIYRYVVVEVMEATGDVTFTYLEKMSAKLDVTLNFIGELHLSRETGHLILSDVNVFESLRLNEQEREDFKKVVDACFDAFHTFMDQLYLNIKQGRQL